MRWRRVVLIVGLLACGGDRASTGDSVDARAPRPDSANAPTAAKGSATEEAPTQWTVREVARRLTDAGLVVTDSGRTRVRHSFLAVEGHQFRVSGSELQIFVYPHGSARRADSERLDSARVAPPNMIIDWVATPHLIASGNLIAIHLTPNARLAERVRLVLEAWHTGS